MADFSYHSTVCPEGQLQEKKNKIYDVNQMILGILPINKF